MAGEIKNGADDTTGFALTGRSAAEQTEVETNDHLQRSCVWPSKELPASELPAEERAKLIEKFGKALEEQTRHASNEAWGTGLMGASLLATRVYSPLRIAAGAAGVVSNFYESTARLNAGKDAVAALGSMPKVDAQRFGKYQHSMQSYGDITGGGYVAAGAVWSAWAVGLVKSPNPWNIAGLGAIGVDLVNTSVMRPKAVSNFHTDFEAWKNQMKK